MEQAVVMINQSFSLFCCAENYSISLPNSLSTDSNYFVRYTYPDRATKDVPAQLSSANVLASQSPEYSHPCTVHAMVYASYEHAEDATEFSLDFVTEFSLDLVSPVEYLFRKFSANEFEMSDKISDKMASALLAMSLSYYYVMGEHVEKETKTDEILSTLLNCSQGKMYMNTTRKKKDSSSEESITQFAEHFKLQNTLQYLSGGTSVGDLPVQLPKPLFPPVKKVPLKKPAITPRAKINSLPANSNSNVYQVPNNRPLSEYSVLQPVVNQETDLEYMVMDPPNRYSLLNPIDSPTNEEDYFFMEQTDDSQKHYQKPLRATKSSPFLHVSDQTSKSMLPRPRSSENVIAEEVYELCNSTTPAEVAAAEAVKKRGPPPRPPAPYRDSHTLDTTKGFLGRNSSSDLETSLESSLRDSRISSAMKTTRFPSQEIASPASDPLPKKKYNLFSKGKAKR